MQLIKAVLSSFANFEAVTELIYIIYTHSSAPFVVMQAIKRGESYQTLAIAGGGAQPNPPIAKALFSLLLEIQRP
jgi:hypothetical protein